MGGCRCTFRACTVTTQKFPGMHFFRYPMKDANRLQKWIEYANYTSFHEQSQTQAKNKVVCALHFRDEYFMNYKKDRLIAKAIPTLERLRNGLVLDYAMSGQPQPIALPPTTDKHLIPPKGYRPLGLPEDFFMDESAHMEVLDDDIDILSEPPEKQRRTMLTSTAPKILNANVKLSTSLQCSDPDDVSTISLSEERYDEEDEEYGFLLNESRKFAESSESLPTDANVDDANEIISLTEIDFASVDKDCAVNSDSISKELYNQALEAFADELRELRRESEKNEREAKSKVARLEAELAETNAKLQSALERADTAELSAKDYKNKFEECEKQNSKNTQAEVAVPKQKPQLGQLTKPQLFNGIKKYLSASMSALVRMEMFAETEREFKQDEKQVSVELLGLGKKVYKYFSDEWRLRLPSVKLVQKWSTEVSEEDEEDL